MDLDKSIIGLTSKEYVFEVENRHVGQFAAAIGDNNPLYTDESYAKQSAYEGLIVPPTFPIAMNNGDVELPIDLDHRRMLHGEQEFIYHKPVRVGDRLHCQLKVSDLYDKEGKSGNMQFLKLDTEMKDETGELVCISRMNIVYRSLAK
ncbi:MaoC family dehydratase N-terminal domain-containing protein [Sporosarcina sp. GW1-11]|uniref:MaoC family dehydratase N-terminal domain-containing protein n=1 Tax=Sporosarcina sp. GW1-11 TaxID=2899126 RepID=UPI00294C2BCD|nr:MaoC family dehydratase N-terminal domain-containing protein [Sporosarcina sp. GW1-11]MDV6377084.1 MaoC family dehydratase N-terminal domain-containing protein [Sporosarcina sp. GW1-11]